MRISMLLAAGAIALVATAQAGAQVITTYHPTVTYYTPAPTYSYYAPTTSYYAPAATPAYYAPTTTYYAPAATTAYYAPATTAYVPTTTYSAPAYYGPVGRPGLFGWRWRAQGY